MERLGFRMDATIRLGARIPLSSPLLLSSFTLSLPPFSLSLLLSLSLSFSLSRTSSARGDTPSNVCEAETERYGH